MTPNRDGQKIFSEGGISPRVGLEADLPDKQSHRNLVKPSHEKYFALSEAQISGMFRPVPLRHEGRFGRSSRNVGRDAMDAKH
jgi:hypothetical protein